jgi:hypothetical protein
LAAWWLRYVEMVREVLRSRWIDWGVGIATMEGLGRVHVANGRELERVEEQIRRSVRSGEATSSSRIAMRWRRRHGRIVPLGVVDEAADATKARSWSVWLVDVADGCGSSRFT